MNANQERQPNMPSVASHESRDRALIALLLLLPFPSLGTAASMFWWPGTTLGVGLFLGAKIWVVILPVLWLIVVERKPLSWSPPRHGGFGPAMGLGMGAAAMICAVYLTTRGFGWLDPLEVASRARQTGLNRLGIYIAGAVYWITLNSLMEEYVWRWFCFRQCERLFGERDASGMGAVGTSALAFTLHHIVALAGQFSWPMTILGSAGVFCGGAIWSWLYLRYRSVWPCYVSHAIVDIPIFVIGYYLIFGSDSLGAVA